MNWIRELVRLNPRLLTRTLLLMAVYAAAMVLLATLLGKLSSRSEEARTNSVLHLIAREKAAALDEAERGFEAARTPDARVILEKEIQDIVLHSEVMTAAATVDTDGVVTCSDYLDVGTRLQPTRDIFGIEPSPSSDVRLFSEDPRSGRQVYVSPLIRGDRVTGYVWMQFQPHGVRTFLRLNQGGFYLQILVGMILLGILTVIVQVHLSRTSVRLGRALEAAVQGRGEGIPEREDEFASAIRAARSVHAALSDARVEKARAGDRLAALAGALDVGLLWLDEERRVDFANDRAMEIMGLTTLEELRATWHLRGAPVDEAIVKMVRTGASRSPGLVLAFGEPPRPFSAQVSRVGEEAGKGFVAVLTDQGSVEALEGDVHLAGQMQSLSQVLRTLMHEVRSPLSALSANVDLLRESLTRRWRDEPSGGEEERRYLGVLQQELKRLNQSLLDLLTRLAPSSEPMERVDLGALVGDIVALTGKQASRQGVALEVLRPGGRLLVLGQPDRLKQALLNVVVNALEIMPRGGRLQLALSLDAERVRLRVTDTGPGLPDANPERIFEMGYTTKSGGSGIGLYVTRTLIEQHGGTIAARSRPGEGTCFEIGLPLALQGATV